jgi:hypothetical protein
MTKMQGTKVICARFGIQKCKIIPPEFYKNVEKNFTKTQETAKKALIIHKKASLITPTSGFGVHACG